MTNEMSADTIIDHIKREKEKKRDVYTKNYYIPNK